MISYGHSQPNWTVNKQHGVQVPQLCRLKAVRLPTTIRYKGNKYFVLFCFIVVLCVCISVQGWIVSSKKNVEVLLPGTCKCELSWIECLWKWSSQNKVTNPLIPKKGKSLKRENLHTKIKAGRTSCKDKSRDDGLHSHVNICQTLLANHQKLRERQGTHFHSQEETSEENNLVLTSDF